MIAETTSCADLHVHSKHSNRPSEWFLRRIGAPESFVEPRALYDALRARGMDFVTITDHNSLGGSLEIADLPGTFLSSELTTYFPEDGCKIHCLVWGVTEAQFAELQRARESLYDLHEVLQRENLPHAIAHPLFRINDRLTLDHVEKLLLLFDRFEGINGSREPRACDLFRAIVSGLTPADIAAMADRHGIEPAGPTPWIKHLTAGSDDHSGLYAGCAFTRTPAAESVEAFLTFLREGRHEPAGRGGSSLRLAHSLYHIAYEYYRSRFLNGGRDRTVIGAILRRLAGSAPESAGLTAGTEAKASAVWRPVRQLIRRLHRRRLSDIERVIVEEFESLMSREASAHATLLPPDPDAEQRRFDTAARIAHQLSFTFVSRAVEHARAGRLIEAIQSAAALGPILLGAAPYLTAFGAQHKDAAFLRAVEDRFPQARPPRTNGPRRAWFTDTFDDLNGVARTIRTLAGLAAKTERPITVVTCRTETPATDFPLRNFMPVGSFALPEYPQQTLTAPPVLEMLAWLEAEQFEELIISTPGPVGLVGRFAGTLLGLRIRGVYHTDFPNYLRQWTEDDLMGDLAWRFMRWFYGPMERIYVPSQAYLEQLSEAGFERERLRVLPRGVDLSIFRPDRRNEAFWRAWGCKSGLKFLYVGRISDEKNVRALVEAWKRLYERPGEATLILVGDGPAREALQRSCVRPDVVFTGALYGEELAVAYASADVFVFPSLTDTFGNVVLEAHASGLPAIVADRGGPPEIVQSHGSGLVTTGEPATLAEAMQRLRDDPALRERLRTRALERARASRWETVLRLLDDTPPLPEPVPRCTPELAAIA